MNDGPVQSTGELLFAAQAAALCADTLTTSQGPEKSYGQASSPGQGRCTPYVGEPQSHVVGGGVNGNKNATKHTSEKTATIVIMPTLSAATPGCPLPVCTSTRAPCHPELHYYPYLQRRRARSKVLGKQQSSHASLLELGSQPWACIPHPQPRCPQRCSKDSQRVGHGRCLQFRGCRVSSEPVLLVTLV